MDLIIRWYVSLTTYLTGVLAPQPQLAGSRARRGAGFLEYMLVATLAMAVFVAVKLIFPDAVKTLLNKITNAVSFV